jgi:ligand-binding sensor domain-containing protein/DNA-binding CsgD family transcriptional regulator
MDEYKSTLTDELGCDQYQGWYYSPAIPLKKRWNLFGLGSILDSMILTSYNFFILLLPDLFVKRKWIILLLLFFSSNAFLIGEDTLLDLSLYTIKHWDIYSGLCSDSITSIYQDSKGFLWIGTYDGVMRYDGRSFMIFDQTRTPGFVGHSANGFLEVESQLWIASGQGLIRYKDGAFQSYTKEDGLVSDHISAIAADEEGLLWIGTNQGLIFFDGSTFQVPLYDNVDPFAGRGISSMLFHPHRGLIVACTDGGLYVNGDTDPVLVNDTGDLRITTIRFGTKEIIAGDRSGGFFRLQNSGNIQYEKVSEESIRDISAGREGFWIITSSELIYLREENITRIASSDVDFGMLKSVPKAIEFDRSGNIWIGTRSGGLYLLGPSRFRSFNYLNGLPESTVNSIAEYPEGTFWIGTDTGLYCRNDDGMMQNGLTRYLAGERIKHLQASRGMLYVSTLSGKGVVTWDGQTFGQIDQEDGLPHRVVKKTITDSRGNLWISTSAGVVSISSWGEWNLYNRKTGFISDEIYDLFEDQEGRIWISTVEDGLIRMESNGVYQRFSEREGLTGEMVFSVRQDLQGDYWVSTASGLFLIRRDDTIYPITYEQGLPYLYIYSIEAVEDSLYFTSVKGFSVASLKEVKETALGLRDFFELDHYDWNSGLSASPNALSWLYIDSRKRVWIPTHKGADCFLQDGAIQTSGRFPPRITKAETPDQTFLDPEYLEYEGTLDYLSLFAAQPGYFGVPDLEYRLVPYQDFWLPLPEAGIAKYTKLNPGAYTFQIRSLEGDATSSSINELPIRIKRSLNPLYFLLPVLLFFFSPLLLLKRNKSSQNRPDWSGIKDSYKLTERELEILKLLSSGKRDKEIAQKAGCAISTVSNTLSRIYKKTGTGGRSDLVLLIHQKVKNSTGKVKNSTP